MDELAVNYLVLRDQHDWDGAAISGLQQQAEGAYALMRLPGLQNGKLITLPSPYYTEYSGIAIGQHGDSYISESENQRIVGSDCLCKSQWFYSGNTSADIRFNPRGLLIVGETLFVTDSNAACVYLFNIPSMELRACWNEAMQTPIALANDSQGNIYVLDAGHKQVIRFSANGSPDTSYQQTMAHHAFDAPYSIAIDSAENLYVSDAGSVNQILSFDKIGALLQHSNESCPLQPRALATYGKCLYAADVATGRIFVFDAKTKTWMGTISAYFGPVSAMTTSHSGALYIKSGSDDTVYKLEADVDCVKSGTLKAGPFDAGELSQWERFWIEAEIPPQTAINIEYAVSNTETQGSWIAAPTHDFLLQPFGSDGGIEAKRYLWIQIILTSSSSFSPNLMQVQAHTTAPSYLNYLPEVYRRKDTPDHFLERYLALFRSLLSDWELSLEAAPSLMDPRLATAENLQNIADILAFELPKNRSEKEWRNLLMNVHTIYQQRGTFTGLRKYIELYTGVSPHIIEAFNERRLWQQGETSLLGLDTSMPKAFPEGLIVPGFTPPDPNMMGLRGDYYEGIHFERLKHTRTDPTVDFVWTDTTPLPNIIPADGFSIRWTGQIQARFSETYTLYTDSDDGLRLWIDGQLIIDNWTLHATTQNQGKMVFEEGRWYTIVLEFFEQTGYATIRLSWSSPSQRFEIIPTECLYAIADETIVANSIIPDTSSQSTLGVGRVVVGENTVQTEADFGAPLFAETAHLFTVVVPAAKFPKQEQRDKLRAIIEQEKPAYTDFHLCFSEPQARLGIQSRLGIDSIVAGPPPPMVLGESPLGLNTSLADSDQGKPKTRVGQLAHLGVDTIIN